jgi:cellulose biosynthesis protein BcsQ
MLIACSILAALLPAGWTVWVRGLLQPLLIPQRLFSAMTQRAVRLAEAPSFGEPIESFDPRSIGAKAYRSLADEFRRRHGRST